MSNSRAHQLRLHQLVYDEGTPQVTSPTGRSRHPAGAHARRWARRLTMTVSSTTAAAVLMSGAPVTTPGSVTPAPAGSATEGTGPARLALASFGLQRWPGHPGRRIVHYRVRPGDTATGLAVRFHAWTDELRAINRLGRRGMLFSGERIRIPVVLSAVRGRHHRHHRAKHQAQHPRAHHARSQHHTKHHRAHHRARHRTKHHRAHPWRHANASRAQVRRVIVRKARHYGVNRHLALAIAWQESGWQQRRRSSAGAIGAMQILPGTGTWMSMYVGRRLNIYGLHDNVTAGIVLFKVLRGQTSRRRAIAAYYQGLGAVQRHGLYPSTWRYYRSVTSLSRRLHRGWNPA